VRVLRHRPLFALVAVASLAIAIGMNATIFGLVDAVLVRPLPGERDTPLMSVFTSESDGKRVRGQLLSGDNGPGARRDVFTTSGRGTSRQCCSRKWTARTAFSGAW
jgi:hypothetical protein